MVSELHFLYERKNKEIGFSHGGKIKQLNHIICWSKGNDQKHHQS